MTGGPARPELSSRRLLVPEPPEEVSDHLYASGHTDGLPIVPPTEERVARFVAALGRDPAEIVAVIPPAMGVATVEKVAVNAVMAGCLPEHLPVVIAAVQAFVEPEFNGRALQDTGNPAGVLILVNGPIRREIGVSVAEGCMGLGSRANLTISRAARFTIRNVGARAGVAPKVSQGFPGRVAFCFGENEEESPWEPLHVERGFPRAWSTVTVVAAQGTSNIIVNGRPLAEDILPMLAHGMINPGANNFAFSAGEPLLALNPTHAEALADAGIGKAALKEYLFEHARVPLAWYPARAREVASLADRAIGGAVPIADSPDKIMVVVAGGRGWHSTFIPTYGDTLAVTKEVGRRSSGPAAEASPVVR